MFRGQAALGAAGCLWWRFVANEAALQPAPSQSFSPELITHFTQGKEVQLQLGLGGEQCGVLVWYTDTGIFLNLGSHSPWTRPQLIGWFQSAGLQELASLSEVGDTALLSGGWFPRSCVSLVVATNGQDISVVDGGTRNWV